MDAVWMLTQTGPAKAAAPVAAAGVRYLGPGRTPLHPGVAGECRPADALARPAEPRAGGDDPPRPADHAASARPVERPDPREPPVPRRGELDQAHPSATPDVLIEDVYLRALCRRPTADEITAAHEITGSATDERRRGRPAVGGGDAAGVSVDSVTRFALHRPEVLMTMKRVLTWRAACRNKFIHSPPT